MALPEEPISKRKEKTLHTEGRGRQTGSGKYEASGCEGPRGPRSRARPASHSPMAVRTAETMTTASESALILPQDHCKRPCEPGAARK